MSGAGWATASGLGFGVFQVVTRRIVLGAGLVVLGSLLLVARP